MTAGSEDVVASDKVTWHRYMDFYESDLQRFQGALDIMEFGVFRGASIRYLHERYPEAAIVGCDILPEQAEWPRSDRIEYMRLDQGKRQDLYRVFRQRPGPYDIVIEDGSHRPDHQRNCLVATLPKMAEGGIYILEDLHTSHPAHPMARRRLRKQANSYHLLLALEHLLVTNQRLSSERAKALAKRSMYTDAEIESLFDRIATVRLYRRPVLPLSCFRCGRCDFDYNALRCRCGTRLMATADSMAAVITVRG